MRKTSLLVLLLTLMAVLCPAQQVSPAPWSKFQFMLGSWSAAGSGSPGEGAGEFSFTFDLQNRVLVRRSHTEYPASANRPAFAHDDLMIIYADEQQLFHADYYDNEGHVIRYAVEFSADGNTCTLVNDPSPSQPRFRLIYKRSQEGRLAISFDIAPPGQPDNFKNYVAGTATSKAAVAPKPQTNPNGPIRLTDALVEFFSGDWIGSGEFASGKKIEADVSFAQDLDRQWLVYRHTDRIPNKYKALGMWGFETGSSRLIMIVTDNFGGARRFSSEGWVNGKVVFEKTPSYPPPLNAGTSSGVNIRERFTFERQDNDTFRMTYETSQDATNWRLGDYLVFKRKR